MRLVAITRAALVPLAAFAVVACRSAQSAPAAAAPSPAAAPAPAAAAVAMPAGRMLPPGVTAAMVAAGDSMFSAPKSCNGCHGMGGVNGRNGPNLTTGDFDHIDGSYESIVHIVTVGITKKELQHPAEHRFPMRPRGGHDLTDDQIRDIAAYVWTLSNH